MSSLPNITGGAGGAAMGGTVGPTTYGSPTVGVPTNTVWLLLGGLAIVWFFFLRKK